MGRIMLSSTCCSVQTPAWTGAVLCIDFSSVFSPIQLPPRRVSPPLNHVQSQIAPSTPPFFLTLNGKWTAFQWHFIFFKCWLLSVDAGTLMAADNNTRGRPDNLEISGIYCLTQGQRQPGFLSSTPLISGQPNLPPESLLR